MSEFIKTEFKKIPVNWSKLERGGHYMISKGLENLKTLQVI